MAISSVNYFNGIYKILRCHRDEYSKRFLTPLFPQVISLTITDYVVEEIMDRDGWKQHFGVDPGPEADTVIQALAFDRFYEFYHGPNPFQLMCGVPAWNVQQICETSLIPTIVPESVTYKNGLTVPYSHTELERLGEGASKKISYVLKSDVLESQVAPKTHLVILLNNIVQYNKPWKRQVQYLRELNKKTRSDCENEPDALSQNTAIIAESLVHGKCPIEGNFRTVETVDRVFHIYSQCVEFDDEQMVLQVGSEHTFGQNYYSYGISVQWKFGNEKRKQPESKCSLQ